jgi:Ca2+-binding EF-hand superfamily protein
VRQPLKAHIFKLISRDNKGVLNIGNMRQIWMSVEGEFYLENLAEMLNISPSNLYSSSIH